MAIDPSVKIDIAAEFTGKKAFDKASKSTSGLEKSVKNLAKTFGLAFGATAVINFAKSSAKAFIEDDNAARSLSVTIKNLGLNYDNNTVIIGRFIDNLEQQTGVLDDELRPAMDRLLRATGSVSKSQELLNLSLDIAAGTGKTVTQVSQSLQKAYLGQTAAIGRLGVGITKAELATGKFEDIQQKLTTLFAGQASSAANSYAGQMAKLQVAANNAKETIGEGLVDALKLLGSDNSIENLNAGLEETSLFIADVIRGIGVLIQKLKDIPVAGTAFQLPLEGYIQMIPVLGSYINILADLGEDIRLLNARAGRAFTGGSGGPSRDFVKEREAKAAAAAIKAAKLAAANRLKSDKLAAANKAKLDKAAAVFEIQKIQIAAALKGKIREEEKTRLLLMQAIEEGNADKAEALAKKLEEIQAKNAKIAADLLAIGAAKDPFSTWAGSLSLALEALAKLGLGMSAITKTMIPGVTYNPSQNADRNYDDKVAAAKAAAEAKAAADKAAADKAAADAAAILGGAAEKAAAEKAAADAAAAKLAKDAAAAAAAAAAALLAGAGITFNPGQNADRNYDDKAAAEAAAAAAALAIAPTNGSPGAGVTYNPSQNPDRNYDMNSNQTPTIIINNNGSVIMQDEFIDVVNDAVLASQRFGYGRTPAGSIPA